MYDLAVIGAGPAGSAAAITAARNGARVVLIERAVFPRQKVCGEFVSAESLDLLSKLLGQAHQALLHQAVRIPRAQLFIDGQMVSAAITPPAASIARCDLDDALLQSAVESGVDAHMHSAVLSLEGDGPFRVRCPQENFEARAIINAAGRWSKLNHAPTPSQNSSDKWIGIKAHYREQSPEPSVNLYFFDGGYCGVQPVDLTGATRSQRVNVSAVVRADAATTLPEVFSYHPALRERSASWQLVGQTVTTSPLLFRPPECTTGNTLRVGDAAAFVDPFVGDGISLALRSGVLAGDTLSAFFSGTSTLEQAVIRYRRGYEAALAPIFRSSSQLRQLLRLPRLLRVPLLYCIGRTPLITRWMVRKTR
jgi:flavin-dependent dehydrogenase